MTASQPPLLPNATRDLARFSAELRFDQIPAEVIEKDYGCGDPSRHLRAGETVLDLGSGTANSSAPVSNRSRAACRRATW